MTKNDDLAAWLVRAGLQNTAIDVLIAGFGERLVELDFPVSRLVLGIFILHPIYEAFGYRWTAGGKVEIEPARAEDLKTARFQESPFFDLVKNNERFRRLRPADDESSDILHDLAEAGVTDYCLFREPFETRREIPIWNRPEERVTFNEGIMGSMATRHDAGFTDEQVERLRWYFSLLCLAMRVNANFSLARAILDTYLGERSGARVLSGQIKRGGGQIIRAAIAITDLRGSTKMSERLELDTYLETINHYYDCTAGTVIEHGGEVLKFMGDGMLAIFPFEDTEPPSIACGRVIEAARAMLARIDELNRSKAGSEKLAIGIGLHVGEIAYGNVGTKQRLDFTAIGRTVNEVAKLENLCKTVGKPLLATAEFREMANTSKLVPVKVDTRDERTVFTLRALRSGD
ncbi:MAG: adenylate/guanylate cyclase domain-containing protein [Salaquimonas sp.]|nr:adenylate/guanylate cyclase domain-containing protein [Salaquimonas sp.]